jgi:hypothetical protein
LMGKWWDFPEMVFFSRQWSSSLVKFFSHGVDDQRVCIVLMVLWEKQVHLSDWWWFLKNDCFGWFIEVSMSIWIVGENLSALWFLGDKTGRGSHFLELDLTLLSGGSFPEDLVNGSAKFELQLRQAAGPSPKSPKLMISLNHLVPG